MTRLVDELLSVEGAFEICVHVDGSTDGSLASLKTIADASNNRLRITTSRNQGKTGALLAAVRNAKGKYVMSFDDDDDINTSVLFEAIEQCQMPVSDDLCGFIYNFDDEDGRLLGTAFPVRRSNFLELRADFGVVGDKKEIVRADLFKSVSFDPGGRYRRVPPSLVWMRIALDYDVYCVNKSIGVKRYLDGGITSRINSVRFNNSYPMFLLHRVHCFGFWRRRYKSPRYFLRSLLAALIYGSLSLKEFRKWAF